MLEIGKTNNLRIVKEVDFGLYLDGGESGEILIPARYVPKNAKVDEYLDVFIYHDSEDRLIATTETPLAQVDQFAYLKVKQLTQVGAFLEWGLMKDLLVPFREQKYEMFNNTSYLVRVYLDKVSKRIAATTKLDRYIDNVPYDYEEGQEVDLIIWEKTDLGYKVIINEEHTGLLYANEIFTPVHVGMKIKGFIKRLREDEKIDVSLQKQGFVHVDETSQMILEKLKTRGGFIEANDNTSPNPSSTCLASPKRFSKKQLDLSTKNG
jgi:predicted RNA-binding protein (virulence factor B family)